MCVEQELVVNQRMQSKNTINQRFNQLVRQFYEDLHTSVVERAISESKTRKNIDSMYIVAITIPKVMKPTITNELQEMLGRTFVLTFLDNIGDIKLAEQLSKYGIAIKFQFN